jgi:hypothetical protein
MRASAGSGFADQRERKSPLGIRLGNVAGVSAILSDAQENSTVDGFLAMLCAGLCR